MISLIVFQSTILFTIFCDTFYFQAINNIFETQGWDFEVTEGHIGSVCINVPWHALMTEDSFVEVKDLYLCLRPHPRTKNDGRCICILISLSLLRKLYMIRVFVKKFWCGKNVI